MRWHGELSRVWHRVQGGMGQNGATWGDMWYHLADRLNKLNRIKLIN